MRPIKGLLIGVCCLLALTACGLLPGGEAEVTAIVEVTVPVGETAQVPQPTTQVDQEPGVQPTGEVVEPTGEAAQPTPSAPEGTAEVEPGTGGGGGGTAGPGDVLFVRQGQVWAIGLDGSNERALTATAFDSVIEDLALSPSGQFLAFTLKGQEVVVHNLLDGQTTTVDTIDQGNVGPLVWALASDTLFYHKLTVDPETSAPATSAILQVSPGGAPAPVVDSDLVEGPLVYPGFPMGDTLIMQQILPGQGDTGQWFLYTIPSGTLTPVAEGFSVWDVSPDGLRLLMNNQADMAGASGGAVPIYAAALDPATGAVNPTPITPAGEAAVYTRPEFGPDSMAILALRRDAFPDSAGPLPAQVASLVPGEGGTYSVTPIPLPNGQDAVYFSWAGAAAAVVQGATMLDPNAPQPTAETEGEPAAPPPSQLWIVPLAAEGTSTLLTEGEFPIVIPAP